MVTSMSMIMISTVIMVMIMVVAMNIATSAVRTIHYHLFICNGTMTVINLNYCYYEQMSTLRTTMN